MPAVGKRRNDVPPCPLPNGVFLQAALTELNYLWPTGAETVASVVSILSRGDENCVRIAPPVIAKMAILYRRKHLIFAD